jgi:hypothetical protein
MNGRLDHDGARLVVDRLQREALARAAAHHRAATVRAHATTGGDGPDGRGQPAFARVSRLRGRARLIAVVPPTVVVTLLMMLSSVVSH